MLARFGRGLHKTFSAQTCRPLVSQARYLHASIPRASLASGLDELKQEKEMNNFFLDNKDLQYYFRSQNALNWEELARFTENDFSFEDGFKNAEEAKEAYYEITSMIGDFAARELAPHALEIEKDKPHLIDGEVVLQGKHKEVFEKLLALDLRGKCLPRELNGQNLPFLISLLEMELLGRGDVSVMGHHGFYGGIALAMLVLSMEEGSTKMDKAGKIIQTRFKDYIEEIRLGTVNGSMVISEPDAGSDMAALRTKAEQDANGNWFITGTKCWITAGHSKYHFVIARTEEATNPSDPMSGLKGLSFFLVPAWKEEQGQRKRIVSIGRLENKCGHTASPTCMLNFDRSPAMLMGKRGDGFHFMLYLMNNARIAVAFESLGLMEAAYRKAREYGTERRSMGKTIDRHEMVADMLDGMQTDIIALRAASMHAAFCVEMSQKMGLKKKLSPESIKDLAAFEKDEAYYRNESRRFTPILKLIGSEKAVDFSRMCIQILGGAGYMKDYGAEKLMRDSLVMPIYEGTTQIQSLMIMKDTFTGILKNPKAFGQNLTEKVVQSLTSSGLDRRVARLQRSAEMAKLNLLALTIGDKLKTMNNISVAGLKAQMNKWDPKRDFARAQLHAEHLAWILGHAALAEVLSNQAKKDPERKEALEAYLNRAEPDVRYRMDMIKSTGIPLLKQLANLK